MNQMQTIDDKDKQRDPKPLEELLASSPLQYLVTKARQITTTDEALHRILPHELAPHCRTMNITANIIVIAVDSAVWATRLRYLAPELLKTLQQNSQLKHVTEIQCRVRPG